MTHRKLKKSAEYMIYGIMILVVLGTIFLIERSASPAQFKDEEDDQAPYVTKTILEDDVPVVSTTETIIRPYTDDQVKVLKGFYDYQAEASEHENALLYYENTYLQNSGVSYGGVDGDFDVVSILDGTVISVKEDSVVGNVVQIRYGNDIIGVYQSLGEVAVKENDTVKQGQIIGKSGNSNISKDLNSHLHFELIIKGQLVDPELYYDKNVNEL